jgi:hypothetical protein
MEIMAHNKTAYVISWGLIGDQWREK